MVFLLDDGDNGFDFSENILQVGEILLAHDLLKIVFLDNVDELLEEEGEPVCGDMAEPLVAVHGPTDLAKSRHLLVRREVQP